MAENGAKWLSDAGVNPFRPKSSGLSCRLLVTYGWLCETVTSVTIIVP